MLHEWWPEIFRIVSLALLSLVGWSVQATSARTKEMRDNLREMNGRLIHLEEWRNNAVAQQQDMHRLNEQRLNDIRADLRLMLEEWRPLSRGK